MKPKVFLILIGAALPLLIGAALPLVLSETADQTSKEPAPHSLPDKPAPVAAPASPSQSETLSVSEKYLLFMPAPPMTPSPSIPTVPRSLTEPMTFKMAWNGGNLNESSWIAAEGTIVEDTPATFEKFLKEHSAPKFIAFDSPGGNLAAGILLGQMLRKGGFNVVIAKTIPDPSGGIGKIQMQVDGICVSACAYAFLGGKTRYATKGLGVHQFFWMPSSRAEKHTVVHDGAADQRIVGWLIMYVKAMGVDTEFVFIASSTDSSDVYWLSAEELKHYNVDNSSVVQEPWRTEPYRDGAAAITTERRGEDDPLSLAFFCRKGPQPRPFLLLSKRVFTGDPGWEVKPTSSQDLRASFLYWKLAFGSQRAGEAPSRRPSTIDDTYVRRDGVAFVALPLSESDLRNMLGSKSLSIEMMETRVHNGSFSGDFSLSGAGPHLRLALRNCLTAD